MLRREDEQLNFADMDNWQERIPKDSFYYCLRQWVENNLTDEQFSHLYSEGKGRPPLSPPYAYYYDYPVRKRVFRPGNG